MSLKTGQSASNDNQSISLYVGHHSCYVGSHIWNLRNQLIDDIGIDNNNDNNDNNDDNDNDNNDNEYHDVSAIYRMKKGKRYPRAMFFDYKDNIRYKATTSMIHNEEAEIRHSSWKGRVNTIFRQDDTTNNISNNDNDININDNTTFDERKVTTWTNFMNPNKLLPNLQ